MSTFTTSSISTTVINNILVIIGIILIIYVVYLVYSSNQTKNNLIETLTNEPILLIKKPVNQVLLLKTHIWNDELEFFAKKLKNESTNYLIDFYILMQSDDYSLVDKVRDAQLKKHVLMFTESDIRKMYDTGFYSMWLSNHWILAWFFRKVSTYQYYWSIEYDVRISGDSSKIWNDDSTADFLYPIKPFQDPNWTWKNHYSGILFTDENKWYGYLQLARYSNRFLRYLDQYFVLGENGQDEMMIFSLYKKIQKEIGLTGQHKILNKLIDNSWSVDNADSDKHKKLLAESEARYQIDKDHLQIFHPIKYQ